MERLIRATDWHRIGDNGEPLTDQERIELGLPPLSPVERAIAVAGINLPDDILARSAFDIHCPAGGISEYNYHRDK